jgi:hypothetical protein
MRDHEDDDLRLLIIFAVVGLAAASVAVWVSVLR